MNSPEDPHTAPPVEIIPESVSPTVWRKLGGGSLSISIIVHTILLAIGVVWIFQVTPEKKAEVDFMPKGGGGGQLGAKSEVAMKKRATMTTMNAPRVAAKGVSSSFTLPEPDEATAMNSVGALSSGGMSGGLGGSGMGGGKGDGKGTGFGSGSGPGVGGGAAGMNPFGMSDPNANALVGSFYNLNFKSKGEPTATDNEKQHDIIENFTTRGWKASELDRYQKAEKKLYQTKIYMPAMAASQAPGAFGLKPDPHPRWIVVYRGSIATGKTGKFRFVGAGDDTLVVRFNGRNVFDFGYRPGTVPVEVRSLLAGPAKLPSAFRNFPMVPPVTFYKYPTTADWNKNIGGLAAGPEVEVVAGKNYPIEILISEGVGGLFAAALMIEETGATYQKAPTGAPILPLFRTDSNIPTGVKGDNAPPYDSKGPVWKVSSQRNFTDI